MKTLTLTILQFNTFVKNILDAEEFLSNVSVVGEVTNFKMSGGHAYFDLKEESAMLSCVKFGASDLNIKNGDLLTVTGKVNFYVKSGRLNFIVSKVQAYGLGELYQRFLMLKEKLESEGLFREEIKKPIPQFSKRIGVVTSETGAVIRDIINVTKSKNPYTDIVLYPSKVQGVGAENELAKGIEYFNTREDIDVIIVGRGGGSLEDLAPFNTEKVVKGIYASNLPIISAVGHETDFTLCDFAADMRAPTPSAAAISMSTCRYSAGAACRCSGTTTGASATIWSGSRATAPNSVSSPSTLRRGSAPSSAQANFTPASFATAA